MRPVMTLDKDNVDDSLVVTANFQYCCVIGKLKTSAVYYKDFAITVAYIVGSGQGDPANSLNSCCMDVALTSMHVFQDHLVC